MKKTNSIILVAVLGIILTVSGCYAEPKYSFSVREGFVVANDVYSARGEIESLGGNIRHIFSDDGVLIGDIPSNYRGKVYYENSNVPSKYSSVFGSWTKSLDYKRIPLEEKLANIPDVEPIYNDMVMIEKPSLDQLQIIPRGLPEGADLTDTSSFMIGDVSVSVIFPESDETVCLNPPTCDSYGPDSEDWTSEEIQNVKDEILLAMDWWALREENAHLTFVYNYEENVSTEVEPINLDGLFYDEIWINDVMVSLDYGPEQYPPAPLVFDYINDNRNQTDWGFVIFVVDSSNDEDGAFNDGRFAYTVVHDDSSGGGPYFVMTYDNQNYEIENMDSVCAHETGHIFGARDEYGSCACDWNSGYLNYANENCIDDCLINENSIMRGGITPFTEGLIDYYARGQIGWQDTDEDGILDIQDTTPSILLNEGIEDETGFYFDGDASINIFPAINPYYNDISINTIGNVVYSYELEGEDWSEWFDTDSKDGIFDSASELYEFIFGYVGGGDFTVQSKAINSVGNENESNIQYVTVTSLPPYCEDSDGGFNIWERGTIVDDYGEYTDECNDQYLLEWFCGEDGVDADEVRCTYGCSLGRCLKKSFPLIRFTQQHQGQDDPL
jgi:hypothetical protein